MDVSGTDSRDVSLGIPAKPDYLVLARLALSAVCRLTPLAPEEVADLKLAITEAANDCVRRDHGLATTRARAATFAFDLGDDRLDVTCAATARPACRPRSAS